MVVFANHYFIERITQLVRKATPLGKDSTVSQNNGGSLVRCILDNVGIFTRWVVRDGLA